MSSFTLLKVIQCSFHELICVLPRRTLGPVQMWTRTQIVLRRLSSTALTRPWRKTFEPISHPKTFYQGRQFSNEKNSAWDEDDIQAIFHDPEYEEFSERMLRLPFHGHKVLVIQPFIKVGKQKRHNTTPKFMLEEAIALIHSLPNWKVLDADTIPLTSFSRKALFGSGNLDYLKKKVATNALISAVFISVNILKTAQLVELEAHFKVPVYDRYRVVIQIFRNHAVSHESKLQIAMAEIPYLKQCVKGVPKGLGDPLDSGNVIGASVRTTTAARRRELIFEREVKLKKIIQGLRKLRERLRLDHSKKGIPTVAVVGYTNAGKTSFIKAMTGEDKLKPRNQLFATLDVTKHCTTLSCNLKVFFIDTVGFISDIPTDLIEPFTATLEDALYADVILHIWDVSNPDFQSQREHVRQTLSSLNASESTLNRMFEVGNKVDRLSEVHLREIQEKDPEMMLVSCKTGTGMNELFELIEKVVLKATNRTEMIMRVQTASPEYNWLLKEVPVSSIAVDDKNSQLSCLKVVITQPQLEIFKSKFILKK